MPGAGRGAKTQLLTSDNLSGDGEIYSGIFEGWRVFCRRLHCDCCTWGAGGSQAAHSWDRLLSARRSVFPFQNVPLVLPVSTVGNTLVMPPFPVILPHLPISFVWFSAPV